MKSKFDSIGDLDFFMSFQNAILIILRNSNFLNYSLIFELENQYFFHGLTKTRPRQIEASAVQYDIWHLENNW